MNDGETADADDNDTDGPAVCVHAYVNAPPDPGPLPDPSNTTDAPEATDRSDPAAATGTTTAPDDCAQVSISANPTFNVPFNTLVTVNRTLVTDRGLNETDNPDPSFGRAPTATCDPSLNCSTPPVA